VTLQRVYLFGRPITKFLPEFVRRNLGKEPDDYEDAAPPTFVLIGCSEKSLIARGNQSGGLAIWTRLPQDIRVVAYKDDNGVSTDMETHGPSLV